MQYYTRLPAQQSDLGILVSISFYFCGLLFETMPRQNDAWDHWYDDLGVSTGRLQRQVKCKFCPLIIAYRADRMLARLGYRHPQGGVRDVSICKMVPRSTKQLFENCEGTVPILPTATLESVNDVRTKEKVEELELVLSQCGIAAGIAHREPLQSSQSTVPSLREVDDASTCKLRQCSLPEGFNASTKEILDKVWASAFYKANIPFNVVRHPTFIHAVHKTARLRMPAYRPPSYNAVRTRLLTTKGLMLRRRWRRSWATPLESMASRSIAMDGTIFRIDLYSMLFSVVQLKAFFLAQSTPPATIRTSSMSQVKSVHS